MGGGGKGGGSFKTYDYFGTIAGLVAWGPIDAIHAVLVDGKEIFSAPPGGLAASGDFTSLQPVESKWLHSGGYMRIYWGTSTQPANPDLGPDHPPLRGMSYLVLHRFLFGRERSSAPNVEVVVSRRPRVAASLVPAEAISSGAGHQANPVACMAEILTSLDGLELPLEAFDAASWTAAAEWIAADPERVARMYCSPLLAETVDAREALTGLLDLAELALAWDAQGRLKLKRLDLGAIPAEAPLISADVATERIGLKTEGWGDVPTGIAVKFIDPDSRWKEAGEKVDNILARQLRGEPAREDLELPFVTSRSQAAAVAARWLTRRGRPQTSISAQVRSSVAGPMQVGDKVLIDVQPEPGAENLLQVAIVVERREPREGPVTLSLIADTMSAGDAYLPSWQPAEPVAPPVLPIPHALVIPLEPNAWEPDAVAVLATRAQEDLIGARLYFAPAADPDAFTRLEDLTGFAVRVRLRDPVSSSYQMLVCTLLDGANGPDAYLAGRTPDSLAGAYADDLLMVLAELDSAGRVVISGGLPVIEFISIVTRAADAPDRHAYGTVRGRRGTPGRAWPAGTLGWILPLVNLTPLTHPTISMLAPGAEGRIRMIAYSPAAEDETDPIPEHGFFLPPAYDILPRIAWTSPSTDPAETDAAGEIDLDITATDASGDLIRLSIISERPGDAPVQHNPAPEFPLATERRFAQRITLVGPGTHVLQVSARDRAGHDTVATRQVVVPEPPPPEPPG